MSSPWFFLSIPATKFDLQGRKFPCYPLGVPQRVSPLCGSLAEKLLCSFQEPPSYIHFAGFLVGIFRSVCLTLHSRSSSELSVVNCPGRRTFPCTKNYSCLKCISHSNIIREPSSFLLGYILLTKKHVCNKLGMNRLGS